MEARELFRGKISQANFIPAQSHTCTQVLGKIQQYEEYELEEALPELNSDLTLGSTITFAQWLRRVRNGLFFPTFYFPSTSAGPDIVFCLKCRVTRKRILCAFQVGLDDDPRTLIVLAYVSKRSKPEKSAIRATHLGLFVHWTRSYGSGLRRILERI